MMSKIVSLIPQAEETNMNQMVTPTSQDKNKVRKYSEEAPSAMKVFSRRPDLVLGRLPKKVTPEWRSEQGHRGNYTCAARNKRNTTQARLLVGVSMAGMGEHSVGETGLRETGQHTGKASGGGQHGWGVYTMLESELSKLYSIYQEEQGVTKAAGRRSETSWRHELSLLHREGMLRRPCGGYQSTPCEN